MKKGKYSVLMSVYYKDNAEWLVESINSILNQSIKTNDFLKSCRCLFRFCHCPFRFLIVKSWAMLDNKQQQKITEAAYESSAAKKYVALSERR